MGIFLGILTAISKTFEGVASKESAGLVTPLLLLFVNSVLITMIMAALLIIVGIPSLGERFWLVLGINVLLLVVANWFYLLALRESDLSHVFPILGITPMLLLLTSPITIGEAPTILGIIGILAIVTGTYILNMRQEHTHWLDPFKSLIRERGPRFMLGTAVIFSITSNVDKIGVQTSSPIFWSFAISAGVGLILLPLVIARVPDWRKQISTHYRPLLRLGALSGLTIFLHMTAIQFTLVSYVIALKRSSGVFSVLAGALFFHEKQIRLRLIGSVIIFCGILLIIFA